MTRAPAENQQAVEDMTCPHCSAPWMKGTGLFLCGEGISGHVSGGCRVYYTGRYIRDLAAQAERVADLEAALRRAAYLAENLHGMIDREAWRAHGGDDGQGHYEGDYRAVNVAKEISDLRALAGDDAATCPQCGGRGTEDHSWEVSEPCPGCKGTGSALAGNEGGATPPPPDPRLVRKLGSQLEQLPRDGGGA